MTEPLVSLESNAPELPLRIKAAASFFFRDKESITFTSIADRKRPDFAGKQEYNFTVWSHKVGITSSMSFLSLSEDAKGNIYYCHGYDRRHNPQYQYIPAEDIESFIKRYQALEEAQQPQPEIPKVASLLDMPKEELDRLLGENTKKDAAASKVAAPPAPERQVAATTDSSIQQSAAIKTPQKPVAGIPKEIVHQYVSPLGQLHDLAKWATSEANEIYPQYAKKSRNNGHQVKYEKLVALVQLESSFDPDEVSSTGCTGLGQFCRATYDGVVNTYELKKQQPEINFQSRKDPAANMLATAVHLAENLNHPKVKGDDIKAYIIHNLGEGAGSKFLDTLKSNPDKVISSKDIAGVEHNMGLYRDRTTDKKWGDWKTYKEAYDHIDDMLDKKERSAKRDLIRAENEFDKAPKKKVADVDIGDDLRQHLTSNVKLIESQGYNHIPSSGIQPSQQQIT